MSIGKFTLFFTELHAYVRGEQLIITTEISIDPDADLLRLILFDANKWPFFMSDWSVSFTGSDFADRPGH